MRLRRSHDIYIALGRVNQPAPGTPVPLSTNLTQRVSKLLIQMIPGLTGKAYLGRIRTMNKSTLAGVARILWPNPNGGISDQFFFETDDSEDVPSIFLSTRLIWTLSARVFSSAIGPSNSSFTNTASIRPKTGVLDIGLPDLDFIQHSGILASRVCR